MAATAALLVVFVGAVGLTGWIFDVGVLKSFLPGRIEMKLPTATAFVLIGLAMFLYVRAPRFKAVADVFSIVVIVLGSLSLLQYVVGRSLLIDSLWTREAPGAVETIHPGRMALNTAMAFIAAGIAALLIQRDSLYARVARRLMNTIVALITLFVLVGYVYQAGELRGVHGANPMALSTAVGFLFCTVSVAFATADDWPGSLMARDAPGALVARILFAASLFIPVFFGWLRLRGEVLGLFSRGQGVGLFAIFNVVVLWIVAAWSMTQIQHLARARQRSNENLHLVVEAQGAIGRVALDRRRVAALLLERLQAIAEADGAAVALIETDQVSYTTAAGSAAHLEGRRFPIDDTVVRAAIVQNAFVAADVQDSGQWRDVIAPSLAAPLTYRGINLGAVVLTFASPQRFTSEMSDMLRLVVDAGASALVRAEQFEAKQTVVDEQWAELQTLQKQFQIFMNNIPAAAFIKDRGGHYIYGNPALARFLAVEVPLILGMTDADFLRPSVAATLRAGDEALMTGHPVQAEPLQVSDDVNAPYWLLLRFPLPQRKGEPFIGGVAIDITELKRAEEKIASMNESLEERILQRTEELEQVNRDLEAFSYSVSHDLRAPLRAVAGYSRILEEDYGTALGPEGQRLLGVIQNEARRMGGLIDDLLAFSRVGRQRLTHSMIDMHRLVSEIVPGILASRPDRQIDVSVGILPLAFGDRSTVRQVLVNLLSNAAKYAKSEGPIRIDISGRAESGESIYCVRDSGVGFEMKYAAKLFGVFQRLHTQDEFEGTGVGLAIVQRIVNAQGGRVWAEAEAGVGAAFFFTLPSEASAAADVVGHEEQSA